MRANTNPRPKSATIYCSQDGDAEFFDAASDGDSADEEELDAHFTGDDDPAVGSQVIASAKTATRKAEPESKPAAPVAEASSAAAEEGPDPVFTSRIDYSNIKNKQTRARLLQTERQERDKFRREKREKRKREAQEGEQPVRTWHRARRR